MPPDWRGTVEPGRAAGREWSACGHVPPRPRAAGPDPSLLQVPVVNLRSPVPSAPGIVPPTASARSNGPDTAAPPIAQADMACAGRSGNREALAEWRPSAGSVEEASMGHQRAAVTLLYRNRHRYLCHYQKRCERLLTIERGAARPRAPS